MNQDIFYKKQWFMWVMLLFITPVGLFILWHNKKFNKPIRISLTIIFSLMFIAILG